MRILYSATSDFKPRQGGIAEMTHQIAAELNREGHETVVVSLDGQNAEVHDASVAYRVVRVAPDRAAIQNALDAAARELNPDVIVVNVLGSHLPECRRVALRHQIPLAIFVYGTDIMKFASPLAFFKVWLSLQWVQGVFSCSDFTRRQLPRIGIFKRHAYTMYTGVPDNYGGEGPQETPWPVPADKKVIVSLCRLTKRKGIDHAVEAVIALNAQRSDTLFLIAGTGSELEALRLRVAEAGQESRIWFLGNVTEEQKAWLYRRMVIYLMPNRRLPDGDVEGFGTTFLEANMYNKPVIGGRSGGTVEAIEDGKTGYLVSGTDVNETVKHLRTLLDDPEKAAQMGRAGRERALGQFAYSRLVPRFVGQLQTLGER